jgi:hypothetical protein
VRILDLPIRQKFPDLRHIDIERQTRGQLGKTADLFGMRLPIGSGRNAG